MIIAKKRGLRSEQSFYTLEDAIWWAGNMKRLGCEVTFIE